ncbi:hypothetical protein WOLCODRAFT_85674 [Wolfiporia cocos MD-104 SS10]|uniref:protein-tyrosine-phosphatase n=1 Tax=Wolfiporia cocos (strain MD-104) TaxID=742152 RepID=A0A2H3JTL7_WOLCO|nr:hypothetical protein WOLCODRAFT_85674 [Wolfiporia cocos MD-104 SS10]
MNQVIDNLWIGDLQIALETSTLKAHNIHSVLTAMRGRTFIRHQIDLDDTEDADILGHLVSAISFIEAELEKERGVLVHCQAGVSRSATIVAAYLMYAQHIDVETAMGMIRNVRPYVQPNPGFLRQLEVFHEASYKVSRHDKATRMYYLERVVQDVMNGDGSVESEFFAKYPRTPTDSAPPTPQGPRRKIRCKMCRHLCTLTSCRQELATREHMLDHGQLGPATPVVASALSPAASRRPSMHHDLPAKTLAPAALSPPRSRRASFHDIKPLTPISPGPSRRPSMHEPATRSRLSSSSAMDTRPLRSSLLAMEGAAQLGKAISDGLSESAVEGDEDEEDEEAEVGKQKEREEEEAEPGKRELASPPPLPSAATEPLPAIPPLVARRLSQSASGTLAHPSDIAAQLYANPKLAALRSSQQSLSMTPAPPSPGGARNVPFSPPILANNKCSGYFVEPMKWMEPFLADGQLAGKIICPNKKCGAKLGNYDWAGVCCSCKEWVVPGFCIHRSKVDEVV